MTAAATVNVYGIADGPASDPYDALCHAPDCGTDEVRDGLCQRHWLEEVRDGVVGRPVPRLWTRPARPLNRKTSLGYEFIDFCEQVLGEELLPWQRWLAIHALELRPDGGFRFRTIVVLVARQNGKTFFLRALTLWRMFMDPGTTVLGAAQNVSLAKEVWRECIETIKDVPHLKDEFEKERHQNGEEEFKLLNRSKYKIRAANRKAGRGIPRVGLLVLDELREQHNWDAWGALTGTTRAHPNAQIWGISNAGENASVVLNSLRDKAEAGHDESMALFEWSAPDDCELDDPEAWAQANPGLGHTISEQAIRSDLGTSPPSTFRTETLCIRVDSLEAAIDPGGWDDCADANGSLEKVRDRVVVCVDVSPDERHVSLVGAAQLDDGRIRVEAFASWSSPDAARRELPDILERLKPAALAWYPSGPAAVLRADLLSTKIRKLELKEITGAGVPEACMGLSELTTARRLVHAGDPMITAHVAGASRLRQGDRWVFSRRGGGHCDAAYATAGAVHVVRTSPPPARKPKPMIV